MARAFTTGQYLSAADNAANQVSGTALTIAFWVYITSTAAEQYVIHKGEIGTGEINYAVRLFDWYDGLGHNRVIWEFENTYNVDRVFSNAGSRLAINTWHHVACVKDGTGATALAIYLNGTLDVSASSARTMNVRNRPLAFGAVHNATGPTYTLPLSGRLAEVGIWDAALSADEIGALAKGYAPSFFRRANLRAYYPLGGRRSPETDEARGIDATVTGATYADHPPRVVYPQPSALGMGSGSPPPAPVANFSATPTSGTAPLTVNFTDTSTNTPTAWAWDFENNGSTDSTVQNPSKVYSTAGTYTVKLTASNAGGSDDEIKTSYITVNAAPPPAPVASFNTTPSSGNAPLTVDFTDTSTNTPTSWAWDFTDNGSTDSTTQNPQYTYNTPGTYTAKLTATNAGGSGNTTRTITVSSPPPPPSGAVIVYTVEMDFGRDGTFAHAQAVITSRVESASWSMGMTGDVGEGVSYKEFATPSRLTMTLDNVDGAWSPDVVGATYRGLLVPGVLVRIKATHDATTYTLWTGKVSAISAAPGECANDAGNWRQVSITAEDPMAALLATEFAPKLMTDVRTDEAIRAVFDAGVFAFPYDATWFRLDVSELSAVKLYADTISALDVGYTTLAWAGDNLDAGRGVSAQRYLREMVSAEAGGRFFWDGRAAKFAFHSRYRDSGQALAATLSGSYISGAAAAFGKDVANVVTVQYEPRAVGLPYTVLWSIDDSFTLRPGQERVLTARYRDATAKDAKVSALVVLPMQVGDIAANEQSQKKAKATDPDPPPGADVSNQIAVTVDGGASSAKVTVRNPLGVTVEVTTLRIRGTPLTTYTRDEVTVSDATSISAYDIHEEVLALRAIDDGELAAGIAALHLARRKAPTNRWEKATLRTGWLMSDTDSTTVQAQLVARTVGDRVRLQDAWSAHDREYIIVGEQHKLDAPSCVHETTWTLKPASGEVYFRLNVSQMDSTEVVAL